MLTSLFAKIDVSTLLAVKAAYRLYVPGTIEPAAPTLPLTSKYQFNGAVRGAPIALL